MKNCLQLPAFVAAFGLALAPLPQAQAQAPTPEPAKVLSEPEEKPAATIPKNITLRVEVLSLSRDLARSLLVKSKPAVTYEETLKLLDANPEVRLELLTWVKTIPGARTKLEALVGFPYGSSYRPPQN